MSTVEQNEDRKPLPQPIALTPDQLCQIAAGTVGVLPVGVLRPILAGPLPIGPVWENYSATL